MHNMLNTKIIFAALFFTTPMLCSALPRAAFGPVESIDAVHSSITVLGQTFVVNSATTIAINGRRVSAKFALPLLVADRAIYIEGFDSFDKAFATSIVIASARYVPGATEVYVLGSVTDAKVAEGLVRIGRLGIDTTTVEPELASSLQTGSLVMVSGIQPSAFGRIVGPITLSVGGSGLPNLQSVGGSGVFTRQSVGGSGVLTKESVGGSGVLSKQSVGGSGVLSKQSVGGSGVLSKQSVGGSGVLTKQSVGGSGVLSKQSVGGSGVLSKQSVGGSGVLTKQSVGGSGVLSKQSVGGSGLLTYVPARKKADGAVFQ